VIDSPWVMQKPISGPPIGVQERTWVAQPGWFR
jgi:hypothetical protein